MRLTFILLCLLLVLSAPARTDTHRWHYWAMKASEIRFMRGRLRSEGPSNYAAPFPSVVLIFRQGIHYPRVIGMMGR